MSKPLSKVEALKLIKRRRPEWTEHQEQWRWYLDSLEGGERYRHADYLREPFAPLNDEWKPWYCMGVDLTTGVGYDFQFTTWVKRNLVPHLSEKSLQGRDLYVLRLFRTPVPMWVDFVCRRYLSRIYAKQINRKGPKALTDWQSDVDGAGTDVGTWFRTVVAPVLLAVGHVDLVFGRPESEDGTVAVSKADAKRLGLDRCVADFILSENLTWWRTDAKGRYVEVLVHERDDAGGSLWRHWDDESSNAYTSAGRFVKEASWDHNLGICPVVRVFLNRKIRAKHVGAPFLGYACEIQREVYNRLSELVISDIFHSHPILQAPEEFCKPGGDKITYGPGNLIPMKRLDGSTPSYQGVEAVDMPQSGAAECRTHVLDYVDALLLHYGLMKPAGQTTGSTVAQSGVSKQFDAIEGNNLLAEVSAGLEKAEEVAAEFAMAVLSDGRVKPADLDAIDVEYPREYDLFTASDLAGVLADIQAIATAMGLLPEVEAEVLKRLITVLLPGLDEKRLKELHVEIEGATESAAARADDEREADGKDGPLDPGDGDGADPIYQTSAAPAGPAAASPP